MTVRIQNKLRSKYYREGDSVVNKACAYMLLKKLLKIPLSRVAEYHILIIRYRSFGATMTNL
jgi:hypothetical protein